MVWPGDILLEDRLVVDLVVEEDGCAAKVIHRQNCSVVAVGWLTGVDYLDLLDLTLSLGVVGVVFTHMEGYFLCV